MLNGTEQRKPTAWQQINNVIPALLLALVCWIAITVVDGRSDRVRLDEKLNSIVEKLTDAKIALEAHNAASTKASEKIAAIHHQEHVTMCVGCHNNKPKAKK